MTPNNNAFAKGIPSVFVVGSPFQVLCAVEAIREFEINEYEFIFVYSPTEQRNKQTLAMLNDLKINFKSLDVTKFRASRILLNRNLVLKGDGKRYKRAFIGDYYQVLYQSIALSYMENNGSMIYLDDGSSSISIFHHIKRRKGWKPACVDWLFQTIAKLRHIDCNSLFYTIFSDIKDPQFIKYPNQFSHLFTSNAQEETKLACILFVGTNISAFCAVMGISETQFEHILTCKLKEIRAEYPTQKILYVPHGRDTNQNVAKICSQFEIEYKPLPICIEYYLYKKSIHLLAVYGFTSTALFNLRKMFPKIQIINYVIENKDSLYHIFYQDRAIYYERNGIKKVSVKL